VVAELVAEIQAGGGVGAAWIAAPESGVGKVSDLDAGPVRNMLVVGL
jgi:hypothetical protein